ncbi:MAG: hypothetical protein VKP70_11990 [Cyanobacteriota bacterium]|nr:hypothetical protein [Cyanobacteriota bacterium]
MPWDPSVLRKYSSTSHFRLLNQVRGELKTQPLTRHPDGEINVGMTRRGTTYRVAVEGRSGYGGSRSGRSSGLNERAASDRAANEPKEGDQLQGESGSFRDRLRAIEMR